MTEERKPFGLHSGELSQVASTRRSCEELQKSIATSGSSSVSELLRVYQAVLDAIDALPPIVTARFGISPMRALYPRWPLRYFATRHIERTLEALVRRHHARTALGLADEQEQGDREAVEEFQQSLPAQKHRLYLTLIALATVLIGWRVARLTLKALLVGTTEGQARSQAIIDKIGQSLELKASSASSMLEVMINSGLQAMMLTTVGLSLSLYVILRPMVPAFNIKRLLFDLSPRIQEFRKSTSLRWSKQLTTGAYYQEAQVFGRLGAKRPREFPFDLVVSFLGLVPWTLAGILTLRVAAHILARSSGFTFEIVGGLILVFVSLRLAWLLATWHRRSVVRPQANLAQG